MLAASIDLSRGSADSRAGVSVGSHRRKREENCRRVYINIAVVESIDDRIAFTVAVLLVVADHGETHV